MAIKFEYTGKIGSGGMFDEDSVKKVTFELDDNDLTVQELLDEFQNFLKGVGYFFKDTQTFEVLDHDASAKEKVLTPTDEEIAEEVFQPQNEAISEYNALIREDQIQVYVGIAKVGQNAG